MKLRLVRTMTCEDDDEADLLETARMYVGATLVSYAQGNPNVKTVKPYGVKASKSTKEFKSLPSSTLSLTFAALYQVIRTDPLVLDKWIKTMRRNITEPWPRGMMKRYINLHHVFEKYRYQIFKAYEDAGGEYMGEPETPTQDDSNTPVQSSASEFEEDFE